MPKTFDSYSKNYNEELNGTLGLTGYDTGTLTKAKIRKLQELFPDLAQNN